MTKRRRFEFSFSVYSFFFIYQQVRAAAQLEFDLFRLIGKKKWRRRRRNFVENIFL